jgi:hypothetical protein
VLYLAIPAHNEVATIGVLLWRLRTVLAEFPREYEVVVYDDASSDDTAAVAEQYERAMPVTVLRGATHLGYAGAVNALLTHVAGLTRYPRRDAVLLLQGDFTDPPGMVPEFARRFEGGADLVVGERLVVADAPVAVRRLFKGAHWAMRPFVRVDGVRDMTASMRLVRISALREALRTAGNDPFVRGDTWTANADLLLRLVPHARRVESVPLEPTYGVRMRETRRVAMRDALGALKWAWEARGRRAVAGSAPDATAEAERKGPRSGGRRREESEPLSVERIREKVRERDGSGGLEGDPSDGRRDRERRRTREREAREQPAASVDTPRERPARTERPPRAERSRERESTRPPEARSSRGEGRSADGRAGEPRPPRAPQRREEPRAPYADATIELDDPFAAPAPRRDPLARALDGGAIVTSPDEPPRPAAQEAAADAAPEPAGLRARHPGDETGEVMDATADADGADADGADADADGEAEEGTERPAKRRRNRRSRRGRRKREGAAGEATDAASDGESASEGESDTEASAPEASAPEASATQSRARPPRLRDPVSEHIDGEPVAYEPPANGADDVDDGDDGDDEAAGSESMSEGAPRQRRRGRRGRRGGARRSRGRRDREGGGEPGGDTINDQPEPTA